MSAQPLSGRRFSLTVSPDRLTVVMMLLPPAEEGEVPPLSPEEVRAELEALGVRFGVDEDALVRALTAPPGVAVEVARGLPPMEGKDGWVEILFPTDVARQSLGDEDQRVDWRAGLVFPEAAPGEKLAVLHPPVPGVPGRAVTGEELPPRKVVPAYLVAGPGVEILADPRGGGAEAVATQPGMPVALRQGRNVLVKVDPLVTIPGDVDLATGNLKVRGSLAIQGSVRAGCSVCATESVLVRGNVEAAEVAAGTDVAVGGQVVAARVTAGGERNLGLLVLDFNRLVAACRQLEERGVRCADGLRLLLATRFGQLRKALAAAPDGDVELGVLEEVRSLIFKPAPDLTLETLEELGRKLHLIYQGKAAGSIKASYVQNATLEAAGRVSVRKGCFYARIVAGGDVVIEGALRAGQIVSGGNVYVGEAGSPGESSCEIEVPREGKVTFKHVHPGVQVRLGTLVYRFEAPYRNVTLRAGPAGIEWS